MESTLPRKRILQLSTVFALIYFFSPNGLASLPGITVSFLLKDTLKMTATQASYFGAITIVGWVLKPLWGIISDAFPLGGYRRRSYLLLTTASAAVIWFMLGLTEHYSVQTLIILFSLSSVAYAFMDVLCDALMVETGKPHNLTGRFQSIQWTAVYVASMITGYAGGWAAQHLKPQTVFSINAIFPLLILVTVLLFIHEQKIASSREQFQISITALKEAFRHRTLWLLAFFLFFWTFSPSFGAPFFYYAVDKLKFNAEFFGLVATIGAASSAFGAILYGRFAQRFKTRTFVHLAIAIGVATTFFQLIYFAPVITEHLERARQLQLASAALLGAIGSITFLILLNAAALACPKNSEGTTFATLTAFWNIGLMGSEAVGGFLFDKIGLQPLIIVSALFTAATWLLMPWLRFADE